MGVCLSVCGIGYGPLRAALCQGALSEGGCVWIFQVGLFLQVIAEVIAASGLLSVRCRLSGNKMQHSDESLNNRKIYRGSPVEDEYDKAYAEQGYGEKGEADSKRPEG
jgi:hypothetical protein